MCNEGYGVALLQKLKGRPLAWGSGRMAVASFSAECPPTLLNDQQLDVADVSVGGACFMQGSYRLKEVVGVVVF